jgi:hypothetical protein
MYGGAGPAVCGIRKCIAKLGILAEFAGIWLGAALCMLVTAKFLLPLQGFFGKSHY